VLQNWHRISFTFLHFGEHNKFYRLSWESALQKKKFTFFPSYFQVHVLCVCCELGVSGITRILVKCIVYTHIQITIFITVFLFVKGRACVQHMLCRVSFPLKK
jgi:hypothetical protein